MSQIRCAEIKKKPRGGGGRGESGDAQDEERLKSVINPHTAKQAYVLLSKILFYCLIALELLNSLQPFIIITYAFWIWMSHKTFKHQLSATLSL